MSGVMTELDDDDAPLDGNGADIDLPEGLSGGQSQGQRQGRQEEDFQIVETDDDYKPLHQAREEIRSDDQPNDEGTTRDRPRESKAERRARQRRNRDQSESELRATREEVIRLREQVESFERGVTPRLDRYDESRFTDQMSKLDSDIQAQASAAAGAAERMSDAVMAGDRDAHHAALRDHTLAVEKGRDLSAQKGRLESDKVAAGRQERSEEPARREQVRPAAPRVDPEVDRRTRDFAAKHTWLDLANAGDRDTRRALFIDNEVRADGFDPRDDDYWEELEDRLKEVLPHRFTAPVRQTRQPAQQPAPQRRGPMVGSAGSSGGSGGAGKTVYMTPARKTALIEIGVLDNQGRIADRERFKRIAAGYQEHDRDNGVGASRQ